MKEERERLRDSVGGGKVVISNWMAREYLLVGTTFEKGDAACFVNSWVRALLAVDPDAKALAKNE